MWLNILISKSKMLLLFSTFGEVVCTGSNYPRQVYSSLSAKSRRFIEIKQIITKHITYNCKYTYIYIHTFGDCTNI